MKINYGRILLISAVLVSAPRWSGAFLFADTVTSELWINNILHWGSILSGLLMGPLEVLATAYIFDHLRRMKPTIQKPPSKKYPEGHSERNYRYWGTVFFAVGLLVLTPIILAPYIVARMNGISMPVTLSYWYMQYIWATAVVIAPIFIVGGVAFVSIDLIEQGSKPVERNERKEINSLIPSGEGDWNSDKNLHATHLETRQNGKAKVKWSDIPILKRWDIYGMSAKQISDEYNVSIKTAYDWKKRSLAQRKEKEGKEA